MADSTEKKEPAKTGKDNRMRWSLAGIILIMLAIWLLTPPSPSTQRPLVGGQREQQQALPAIQTGTFKIVAGPWTSDGPWKGISCYDPTKRLDWTVTNLSVYVHARINSNNQRIIPVTPINLAPPDYHIEITNGYNTIEFVVDPGQKATEAWVAWTLSPRTY